MNGKTVKVMIVEDEVLIGLMLAKKLRARGYEVAEVQTSGEDAVERAGAEKPDVILMDVTLAGEMSGIEAAQIVKDQYDIPVIIFSGYDDKNFYEQVARVNPSAVLKKTGPISDITRAIDDAAANPAHATSSGIQNFPDSFADLTN